MPSVQTPAVEFANRIGGTKRSRYQGCLLGGAVGDALGAPVEFDALESIRRRFGDVGIRDYAPAYGRAGAITDDTQMTLFTAEGMLRARMRGADKGSCNYPAMLAQAYQRWYHTQSPDIEGRVPAPLDGWLVGHQALHAQRAPGLTCMRAVLRMPLDGPRARNDSKGCGGVMRVAPIGLYVASFLAPGNAEGAARAFQLGVEAAAITHGHPTGQLAAGVFAMLVALLVQGVGLSEALDAASGELAGHEGHDETLHAIRNARTLAANGPGTVDTLVQLGQGWIAEEALAIGIYCALVARNFEEGIVLAVNHGGDSDSTGSIAGSLLGAILGVEAIPKRWMVALELREVIREVADDLASTPDWRLDDGNLEGESAIYWRRYPG